MKTIFFDLDGTLYEAEPIYHSALERSWVVFRESEYALVDWESFDKFKEAYLVARAQVKARVGVRPSCRSRLLYFKQLTENLTGKCRPDLVLALERAYASTWSTISFENARKILEDLKTKFALGMITNQLTQTQLQKLSQLDPNGELFDWVVTSEEVGFEKPAPEIFEEALKRAGCRSHEAVMIGDDWHADIKGALERGWQAVFVSSTAPEKDHPNLRWVRNLSELRELYL